MSTNLFASFEKRIDSVDPNGSDRVFVCKHQQELDALAKTKGVDPLSRFFSYSEEELEDMGMEAPPGAETQWFTPSQVEETLSALLAGMDTLSLKRAEDVRIELTELLDLCRAAEKNATRIRFYVGF